MYIRNLGSDVIGEVFLTPTDSNSEGKKETWLMAQYYDGKKEKLIKFKEPEKTSGSGSILDRIQNLEKGRLYDLEMMKKIIDFINKNHKENLDPMDSISKEIEEIQNIINSWEELQSESNSTGAAFNICNVEVAGG